MRQSVPRLNDAERLAVQILNLTASSVDLRSQPARAHRALFTAARDLRSSRGRRAIRVPQTWWTAENRVEWAIVRIRVALGDPVPARHVTGGVVRFPDGEQPSQHTREDDIRLVLDYLGEITR